ncbi:DegT/DnrJ/EryC1/StrS family aminotransferase [Ureibacillus sp. FSL K6-8385]|uniref:DegT/DnrJ/EryC1/StrS family aminotransferase n=1 Tax=Ureibacillus terrenus TaxID=118246 RepID=A0A540V354_9BACL|nr:DegT/DnrJ/EryC1/StrS family aminotransferase [Ureibacillus terrenus]MED3662755.1 DegT/DnrJ/EryC1/StrS family aminotransferase [Ureibacillus terrenus]MED3763701.1 DegT/DnrJ/EryC1/StrS family aminotransferase [Ureibacillus terrenus]TQE91169.1 DegT/DnrJ/EryC1/StrS family aminotransferase [Ureibacillus terrenus]
MNIPLIDLKKEYELYGKNIEKAVAEVLQSGSYILGDKVAQFESEIANYLGVKYAAGVANGTDALLLALEALGIGEGDEVITSPFTFFATAEVIAKVGAKPVFVDIEPETYNIDVNKIEEAITNKTKAIIVVHLFGMAAEMDAIMEIASKHRLKVIEDACQAIGTEYKGKRVGGIGDIGCFSFFPTKNLGAFGDGGLIVTNHLEIYEKIYRLRNHGSKEKYIHTSIGMNSRLDEIQAAILLEKLKLLDMFIFKRIVVANKYSQELHHVKRKPPQFTERQHTYHQYCIEVDDRDRLAGFLKQKGIATGIYYPVPLHLQKAFQYLQYKEGDFPVSENASKRILALPINPTITVAEQEYIIKSMKEFAGVLP